MRHALLTIRTSPVSRSSKFLYAFVGLASVVVLGIGLFRPFSPAPVEAPIEDPAIDQLELFLTDAMDYGLPFSRVLAEKRIEKTQEIARTHPALAERAREVADSLRARLDRNAKITR